MQFRDHHKKWWKKTDEGWVRTWSQETLRRRADEELMNSALASRLQRGGRRWVANHNVG